MGVGLGGMVDRDALEQSRVAAARRTRRQALNNQDRFCCVKPRSVCIWGRATPLIEVSMMTMNWAAAMSPRAHLRRLAGADCTT